jgi:sulfate adenylyltransferase subunit 1 (EFTu-like GTPase family)
MKRMNITLLGHKDHGKSTLIGRLFFDTRSVMVDRVEEVKKTCEALGKPFEYAFLLDSFQEEREGGMTIDVIHAQIKGRQTLYDCIDVPGHKELIKNMLTGASHADAGILIVSAHEGIEEQTGHHLRLAQWLGLNRLIVAINKMDRVGFRQERFEEIKEKVLSLGGAGLGRKIAFVPVSAYQGDNVVSPSSKMPWYPGPTLFDEMEGLSLQEDLSDRPLRFPIQDLYRSPDGGRIVAGRIESGTLRLGQPISFAKCAMTAKVKTILTSNGNGEIASAGENVGLLLDPDLSSLARGDVGAPAEEGIRPKGEVMAHAIFLETPSKKGEVECGTDRTEAEIGYLSSPEVGEVTQVVLRFKTPMVVDGSKTSIGRLAIKQNGKIVAVAVAV